MAKLILALLVIAALVFGVYFSLFGKIPSLGNLALNSSSVKNPITSLKKEVPTPTPDTSNRALDSDFTALERDLAEIEKDNVSFTQELNSL